MSEPAGEHLTEGPTEYLATLLRLSQLISSSLDLNQVLDTAVSQVVSFVGAERGFILLVDVETGRVWGEALHNIAKADLERALTGADADMEGGISRTLVEHVLDHREPVLSYNAMEDPRFADRRSVHLAHLRSVLCVPLITSDRLLGVIYLDNRLQSGIFNEHQLNMLRAFAAQAAVAIDNARLYENLRKSLDERLRLQEELNQQETRRFALEEATRLKSDFVSFVAHELRNPLTTIRGCVQTLMQDTEHTMSEETQREFYEAIEADADRLLDMINELLDVSRLEAGRRLTLHAGQVNLKAVLTRLARRHRFSSFFTERHSLDLQIAEDLRSEVTADEEKIIQIVVNLLSNASKYSPEGGVILLKAFMTDPDWYCIEVTDHGIGMTQEQSARLFRRYERLDRAEIRNIPGTGLGLFLVKNLVELHGGTVSCSSEPGQGSTFRVVLPVNATTSRYDD